MNYEQCFFETHRRIGHIEVSYRCNFYVNIYVSSVPMCFNMSINMKRTNFILFALFLLLSSGQLWAQEQKPYKPAETFKGDTVQYLEYNYRIRCEQYVGKTVGEILKELEYPVLYIAGVYRSGPDNPGELAGLDLGVRQIGKEPNPLKDYYIAVCFEYPPLLSDYFALYDRQNPVLTPQIYDFIKDLKVSGVGFNPHIIKDPEVLKRAKQIHEEQRTRAEKAEKEWEKLRKMNNLD